MTRGQEANRADFERDLAALCDLDRVPVRPMRLRYKRTWWAASLLGPPVRAGTSRRHESDLTIALYEPNAPVRSKPTVTFYADPNVDVEQLTQESVVEVHGWPSEGRAVMVLTPSLRIWSRTPCTTFQVRSPRLRGERDDSSDPASE
jgi:hypothetical protein